MAERSRSSALFLLIGLLLLGLGAFIAFKSFGKEEVPAPPPGNTSTLSLCVNDQNNNPIANANVLFYVAGTDSFHNANHQGDGIYATEAVNVTENGSNVEVQTIVGLNAQNDFFVNVQPGIDFVARNGQCYVFNI